ncbi:5-formyltetrahydrofolate cyclo-ligase [Mycobacterium florentinum]|uniref:5-formyltetrahydrofolate cyclo-ligase n=1 Tax=Mycobacterium florentinum TaxID=292462 RepID=A0A1X1UKK9_MYCFL|nr:5-formyltetrahydrofolate cyclo-ligase [Mycobacterium florentinum]MCV7411448.1 5-formyltetrahydrofolate cyclo-ligase [Mycobacterium florentinum]ORV57400.1 5-formyltetrahydrofolate cyclo-ligase [Mycobacterium florentinum]BBX80808.1 5-formyltetrahydrofolate cyclo-ligase [Mycobacterium florentinum]
MTTSTKAALREQLLAARSLVADDVRAGEARKLTEQLALAVSSGSTVCAYVPVGTEPGSVAMLDMLLRHSRRVLLPVARTTADGAPMPLRWAEYRPGELVRGRWGLLEPPEPWLSESALAEAEMVVVPALAVDRRGARLGRGRGYYDRSLAARNPQARLVAVVRDEEFVDELPADPHDVPMTHVITPERGVVTLRAADRARE